MYGVDVSNPRQGGCVWGEGKGGWRKGHSFKKEGNTGVPGSLDRRDL